MASAVLKACYLVFLVNQRLLAETANFTPKFLYFHLHYSDSNLLMIIDPPESTQPARTNTSLDHLQRQPTGRISTRWAGGEAHHQRRYDYLRSEIVEVAVAAGCLACYEDQALTWLICLQYHLDHYSSIYDLIDFTSQHSNASIRPKSSEQLATAVELAIGYDSVMAMAVARAVTKAMNS